MSGDEVSKSRGGRPRERDEAKRSAITMRTTPSIKAALQASADRDGRSLAQEIEQRLERSIQEDENRGGPMTAALVASIVAEIATIERFTGKSWAEDTRTYAAVRSAVIATICESRPLPAAVDEVGWAVAIASGQVESLRDYQERRSLHLRLAQLTADPDERARHQGEAMRLQASADRAGTDVDAAIKRGQLAFRAERHEIAAGRAIYKVLRKAREGRS